MTKDSKHGKMDTPSRFNSMIDDEYLFDQQRYEEMTEECQESFPGDFRRKPLKRAFPTTQQSDDNAAPKVHARYFPRRFPVTLRDETKGDTFFLEGETKRYEMTYDSRNLDLYCNNAAYNTSETFQGKKIKVIPRRMQESETEDEISIHPYPGIPYIDCRMVEDGDCGPEFVNEEEDEDGFYRDVNGKVTYRVLAHDKEEKTVHQEVKHYGDHPWLVKYGKEKNTIVTFRNLHTGDVRCYNLTNFQVSTSFMLNDEFYYLIDKKHTSRLVECCSGKTLMEVNTPDSIVVSCKNYAVFQEEETIFFLTIGINGYVWEDDEGEINLPGVWDETPIAV